MASRRQVIVIGGGETHDTLLGYIKFLKGMEVNPLAVRPKGWKSNLQADLGEKYQVLNISMPSPLNAKYFEWEIYFKKVVPFLKRNVVLVGHSLGGIFLVKYLQENKLPVKIKAVMLVAAPYNIFEEGVGMADFFIDSDFKKYCKQVPKTYIFQAEDDPIVNSADALEYNKSIPGSKLCLSKSGGHFIFDEHLPRHTSVIETL